MPIRSENKDKYPPNWPEIRDLVRQRSRGQCEKCGIMDGALGYRDQFGNFHELEGTAIEAARADGTTLLKIVLTVAHLDHDPTHNDLSNLRHWCQQCHNRYDALTRSRGVKKRRREAQEETQLTIGGMNDAEAQSQKK